MSKVGLIKGNNRYQNIIRALKLIEPDIKKNIKEKHSIVIKPNFVSTTIQLAATHVDVVRAVLDFLKPLTDQKITIAEGAALGPTKEGFRNFGYFDLEDEYDIDFVDLNTDHYLKVELWDRNMEPLKFRVAKTIADSDFRISLARLKTHDRVIATFSQKNIAVGALLDKPKIHQGIKAINHNLAKLAEVIPPHLSVIDGFEGMEGEGPSYGRAVPMGIALSGLDFLAVDSTGARLMGFDPKEIGYLYYCWRKGLGELEQDKIEIIGNSSVSACRKKFKPHSGLEKQRQWK